MDTKAAPFEFLRCLWVTDGTPKDTPLIRFGTVRPRVQIPGPRPDFEFSAETADVGKVMPPLSSVVVM